MDRTTCIYCGETSSVGFPKDHVIPRAFGRFRNNLTLDCVCGQCNAYFGRELEVFLTRDSIEALLRVRHGLKVKSDERQIGRSRLSCTVVSSEDCRGARILSERDSSGTLLRGKPVPQVGFRKFGETERYWFLEADLDRVEAWERFRTDADTLIVGSPGEDLSRLCRKLTSFGVVFKSIGSMERFGGLSQMYAEPRFDDILFRGVAKIAFNFLARVTSPPFALREEFRSVRDYVRRGAVPRIAPVTVVGVSGAKEDDGISRRMGGHAISIFREDAAHRVICRVTLFDHLTYQVVLSETDPVIWYPLNDGRYFDLRTLTIGALSNRN
jgi:hypothetical protein